MSNELAHDLSPLIKIYKDGRVERLTGTTTVPPSLDPKTGVHSNDVVISHETGVSARIYIPKPAATTNPAQRLPLLVYFHGGCFCIETAASPTYHNYLNSLAPQANAVIVSVDYRNAPEHPLPATYDDSWEALTWVAAHSGGKGPDGWLNTQANFRGGIFLAGDSTRANMC